MLATSVDTAPYIALDKAFPSITAYPDMIKVSAANKSAPTLGLSRHLALRGDDPQAGAWGWSYRGPRINIALPAIQS